MKVTGFGTIELSPENMSFYNRKNHVMTGKTLTIEYENGMTISYIVFTGNHTWYSSVRDCGNHYIYAGYSSYYRIEKDNLEITADVEDE